MEIAPIKDSEFEASATSTSKSLSLRFWGNADLRVNTAIGTFLDGVDREALKLRAADVVVDFRELVFMNSSCLKEFVRWIGRVSDRDAPQQYRIRFLRDPAAHWQSRSLQALSVFAPRIVLVEVSDKT